MRYEELKKLLDGEKAKDAVKDSDYSAYEDYEPMNFLGKHINPLLDKYVNPVIEHELPILDRMGINSNVRIPEVSVADRKKQMNLLSDPEYMASSFGMGSIKNTNMIKELLGSKATNVKLPKLDTAKSKNIADMFAEMKHDPSNPETKAAYDKLISEVSEQFDKFQNAGINIKKIKGENPYKNSSDLLDDIHKNNTIQYFPTEQGFGSSDSMLVNNPMLNKSGKYVDGEELLNNDVFRVVHDLVGHGQNNNSFGPMGEEIAYQAHKGSLSPLAQKALTTETRAQNSFVNYGPNGEFNRANPGKTIFADQKIGLLPDEAMSGGNHIISKDLNMTPAIAGTSSLSNDEFIKRKALQKLIDGDK